MNFEYLRHRLRGRFLLLLKRRDGALREYYAALLADPASAATMHAIAYLHAGRGEDALADRMLRAALEIAPGDADAWFNLGFVCERQGRPEAAIEAFEHAVARKPGLDRAWYGMGLACAILGRHAEAAKALAKAAELQPMNTHAWYNLGMAYHTLHDADKVKEVILHLHRFDPKMSRQLILDAQRSDLAHLIGT
jgi:tetratricopeptide (TPR) repeat protein